MRYLTILLLCAPAAVAQTTTHQIALNYNYNGIVHAGESGDPDNSNGYRSISDRGLDFQGGVPSDSLVDKYSLVGASGVVDIVHLGCRPCTGWNGYDSSPNGDCRGTLPAWLTNPDHSGAQTTWLASPITFAGVTEISCIFHISDGGGNFDMVLHTNIGDVPVTFGAGDWYAGPYAGTDNFDCGSGGAAGLHINENTATDSGSLAGASLQGITFQNASNGNAGYAIFGCNVTTIVPQSQSPIALNYNYNGMVHAGEDGQANNPNGYRSISDRGLNVTSGSPSSATADKYDFVENAFELDIVHLGNRCNTWICYDPPSGDPNDCRGTYPDWMPQGTEDQTGPQTTILSTPLNVAADSNVSVIFHISDGGGNFDLTCGFASGASIMGTVGGGDWFAGPYAGSDNFDCAGLGGAGLHINEGSVDIGSAAGDVLTSITFGNQSNSNAGYAIFAANGVGMTDFSCPADTFCYGDGSGAACPCGNTGVLCGGCANSAGSGATLSVSGTPSLSADSIVLTADGLVAGLPCLFFSGANAINGGLGISFGDGLRCAGSSAVRIETTVAHSSGSVSTSVEVSTNGQAYGNTLSVGEVVNYQCWYRDNTGVCGNSHNMSNGLTLTWEA